MQYTIQELNVLRNHVSTGTRLAKEALKKDYPDFYKISLVEKIDLSPSRVSHRGGKYAAGYGFNLAGHYFLVGLRCWKPGSLKRFIEYKSYGKDPIIGDAIIDNVGQDIFLSVGHEVAHAAQRYVRDRDKLGRVEPHGDLFKHLYRIIRLGINHLLPDQKIAKSQYEDLVRKIKKREFSWGGLLFFLWDWVPQLVHGSDGCSV